jgi:hypothetical protein
VLERIERLGRGDLEPESVGRFRVHDLDDQPLIARARRTARVAALSQPLSRRQKIIGPGVAALVWGRRLRRF